MRIRERLSSSDVAVELAGTSGSDAERDQHVMFPGDGCGLPDAAHQLICRRDDVIRREDAHDAFRIRFSEYEGRKADAGGGIAAARLSNNLFRRQSFCQLLAHGRGLGAIGNDQKGFWAEKFTLQPGNSLLNHGALADDLDKLFRPAFAASGPETRSGSARHDHCMQHIGKKPPWRHWSLDSIRSRLDLSTSETSLHRLIND